MPAFEHALRIRRSPDEVFALVADPSRLPEWVATMTSVDRGRGDAVRVAALVGTRVERGRGHYTVDRAARTARWGGEGERDYGGSVRVEPDASGRFSLVRIRLHTLHEAVAEDVESAIEASLENLRGLLAPDSLPG